jgi:2-polyprenyl-6-methoxyphenol hydroxylase-like FAD-dependent oxidoreductase
VDRRSVIIIGAGPAGCTAAILLARASFKVSLVEQHRFPRDKVCGECISALGIDVARRIGVVDSLERLGAVPLRSSTLVAANGDAATIELPSPMWGLSRRVLDHCLLAEARLAGAEILQPARCEKIVPGASPAVHVRDLTTNALHSHSTSHLLICDGKGRPGSTNELGIKAHFVDVCATGDVIALFGVRGHYVGLAPIEHDRWNVAMSVPAARVARFRGDFDLMFLELRHENVALDRAFEDASRAGPWLASALPRFSIQPEWPEGTIPLGNAAAALDPIGGEGIGLAMRSAELAAAEVIKAEQEARAVNTPKLRGEFRKLWQLRSAGCRAAALAVSHPVVARIAAPVLQHTPALRRLALQLTGKLA